MIAKRVLRRKESQSRFSALALYILGESKAEKVADARSSHCGFEDPRLAIKEIEATQSRNQRSKADKTYHLVISFPAGEKPTGAQLEDIEAELCWAIGLDDHQRLSALHTDTDNVHLHVAINKIHPLSHRAVEPYSSPKGSQRLGGGNELLFQRSFGDHP